MSYVVAAPGDASSTPFPLLSPCFDFSTSTGVSGAGVNLLVEQNIEPGNQVPNFNRYRATNFLPVRRLIDAPLARYLAGGPLHVQPRRRTFDIYRMRFTFVGIVGQSRSLWYDTGVANPNYLGFIVTPLGLRAARRHAVDLDPRRHRHAEPWPGNERHRSATTSTPPERVFPQRPQPHASTSCATSGSASSSAGTT